MITINGALKVPIADKKLKVRCIISHKMMLIIKCSLFKSKTYRSDKDTLINTCTFRYKSNIHRQCQNCVMYTKQKMLILWKNNLYLFILIKYPDSFIIIE